MKAAPLFRGVFRSAGGACEPGTHAHWLSDKGASTPPVPCTPGLLEPGQCHVNFAEGVISMVSSLWCHLYIVVTPRSRKTWLMEKIARRAAGEGGSHRELLSLMVAP